MVELRRVTNLSEKMTYDDESFFTNDTSVNQETEIFIDRNSAAETDENDCPSVNQRKLRWSGNSESYLTEENNNLWDHSSTFDDHTKTCRVRSRSFQLSSLRAIDGPVSGKCIRPYGDRLVKKKGNSNISLKKYDKMDLIRRYARDIFTTLLDLSWFWVIALTAVVYVGHWLIFGGVYWIFAILNDDYAKIRQANILNATDTNEKPCVSQVYDFVSAFLFSMESETTIGYGSRAISTACPVAVACLTVQCVISAIFDTWVIGMCFMRLARPDARCSTTLFAKSAVICTRDGQRCLLIRVANLRKSLLLGVTIRARIVTLRGAEDREIEQGHELMLEQHEILFSNASNTMLTAPMEYCHVIDKDSPLKDIPASYINQQSNWFEIIVVMSGTIEATGLTMHAQASYLSSEIKNGHRYAQILTKSKTDNRYIVDFSRFHDTVLEPKKPRGSSNSACDRRSRRNREKMASKKRENNGDENNLDDVFEHIPQHKQPYIRNFTPKT